MDTLDDLIKSKRAAMAKAQADAEELARQVEALEGAKRALKPTGYEQYIAAAKPSIDSEPSPSVAFVSSSMPVDASKSRVEVRNKKGALTPVILNVLDDGIVRNMDEVLRDVNARMEIPTTRQSLRATLGTLREKAIVASPGYGKYTIHKGESPANSTATNSEGEAFSLQPDPDQDL